MSEEVIHKTLAHLQVGAQTSMKSLFWFISHFLLLNLAYYICFPLSKGLKKVQSSALDLTVSATWCRLSMVAGRGLCVRARVCSGALFWGGEGKRNRCVCEKFFLTSFNHRALCSDECLAGRERKRKLLALLAFSKIFVESMSMRYLRFRGTCSSGDILLDSQEWDPSRRRHKEWGSLWVTAAPGTVGTMGSVMCESNFTGRFKDRLFVSEEECGCFFLFVFLCDSLCLCYTFMSFLELQLCWLWLGVLRCFWEKNKKRFMGLTMIRRTAMWPENMPVIIPVILNGFTSS